MESFCLWKMRYPAEYLDFQSLDRDKTPCPLTRGAGFLPSRVSYKRVCSLHVSSLYLPWHVGSLACRGGTGRDPQGLWRGELGTGREGKGGGAWGQRLCGQEILFQVRWNNNIFFFHHWHHSNMGRVSSFFTLLCICPFPPSRLVSASFCIERNWITCRMDLLI